MSEPEEVERVFEALDSVEAMPDRTARARAISQLLKDQRGRNPRLKEYRRQVALDLKEEGMSVRKIAAEIGVSAGTVQDLLRGHSGSWAARPKSERQRNLPESPSDGESVSPS